MQKAKSSFTRPRLRTTREGKIFIVVTLGVGVAAVNTGNNLLYLMLGFLLSLIVLSGVMSEIALRHIEIERRLPSRAFANTPMLIEIAVRNRKSRRASYSLEIEDIVENVASDRRCYFLKIAANGEQLTAYRRTHPRRGVLRFTGFRVATRYPFGLFEKWRVMSAPEEFVVYPALLASRQPINSPRRVGLDGTSYQKGPGVEIAGLRDHRSEDEMRNVHWQRTASLGRMVVREREREEARQLTLLIDNARPETSDEDWIAYFERMISEAAFLAEEALQRGSSVEVVTRGARSQLVANGKRADPLWRFLALLHPVSASHAPPFESIRRGHLVHKVAA